jgi:hypothetical protein
MNFKKSFTVSFVFVIGLFILPSNAEAWTSSFDCGRLTNDEGRATCFQLQKGSATPILIPRSPYPSGFDCGRLTNDEARNQCYSDSGVARHVALVFPVLPSCPSFGLKHNCFGEESAYGNRYIGEFRDGKKHGRGIESFPGAKPTEGIWENGRFIRVEKVDFSDRLSFGAVQTQQQASSRAPEPVRSPMALAASVSLPDVNGVVVLNITTGTDTGSLRINGDEEGGSNTGRYSVRRFAPIGETKFEIQATDRFGNVQRQIVSVTRTFTETAVRLPSLNPTRVIATKPRDAVAIIIGIEKYRRSPSADFASRDASLFVDYAQRALGVRPENIKLLADEKAESSEILLTLRSWLPTRVNREKTDVFVFYSGHGLPSPDGESLLLLPYDVNRDLLDRTAISQKEVIDLIAKSNPRSATLFMDACYSGQTRTGEALLASARPLVVSAKQGAVPKNFTVFSASAPDQISSSSPEVRHGIFSYFLMRGLEGEADQNRDGQISVAEMQAFLAEQVARQALSQNRIQRPQVTGDQSRVLVGR